MPAPLAALIIMDGLAMNPSERGNAVKAASTPNLDRLMDQYPWSLLSASGRDVGLMDGQMGDSNVGHLNLGAGRVVKQYVLRILDAIEDGSFFQNEALTQAMETARRDGVALHLMGLISPGGVHSHSKIAEALVQMAKDKGVERLFIHAFTDGRDVPPKSGLGQLQAFEDTLSQVGLGTVASVSGRYYAMDRDRRWDRTEAAYRAIVTGQGESAVSAVDAVEKAYARGETDEFILPTVILDDAGAPKGLIKSGDVVIFFNFRADRARQLTRAFIEDGFSDFDLPADRPKVSFTSMTRYEPTFDVPYAFEPTNMEKILGEVISDLGWRQLRVAETEKYAHVTFFFNGGREEPFPGEERRLIPSPKVATYDLKPEMSAFEIVDTVEKELSESKDYRLLVVNFANCDMVGHTGDFDAAVKAVETVDTCVQRVLNAVRNLGGVALVTADHGNADQMVEYDSGGPHTFHTMHPVPCILVSDDENLEMEKGRLADIAPTLLELLGVEAPEQMDGKSLIRKSR